MCETLSRGDEAYIHCREAPLVGWGGWGGGWLCFSISLQIGGTSSPFISMRTDVRTHMLCGSVQSKINHNSQKQWVKLSKTESTEIK